MKKIFTNLKKMSLGIFATFFFAGSLSATTYTASQSGNWSNATTWGGSGSPGSTLNGTLGNDNVIIPAGITVTLDMNVTVTGLLSYIKVTGNLNSTPTNSLIITQGSLQGAGSLNLEYIEFSNLGTATFTGALLTNYFVNAGSTLALTGNLTVYDTLYLNSGSIAFNAGSSLNLSSSSNIKVNSGTLSVNSGILSAINGYNLVYVGNSKTSGIETSISGGPSILNVNMNDSSQVVTMGSDMNVNASFQNNMGKLAIGTHTLKLYDNYQGTSNGSITGTSTSRFIFGSSISIASTIRFTNASQFQYFELRSSSSFTANYTGNITVDTINIVSGNLNIADASKLTIANNGLFIMNNGVFTLSTGSFIGTNAYSLIYRGGNKNSSFETTGPGLKNIMLDLTTNSNVVAINNNLNISGVVNMNNGILNLNSHNLNINGTYVSTLNGNLLGSYNSSVRINNTATSFNDTLNFTPSGSMLDSLYINTMASTWVRLGTGLSVNTVSLSSGSLMLTTGDLTVNSTGSIMGYDSTKYIGTSGSGSLVMNVNSSASYMLFPVGTNSSYSPASLQMVSGTSGMFHVNVQNGMLSGGSSGSNLALSQSIVNRTWYIQEPIQSGSLNANLMVQWKTSEEVNNFDETHAYIAHYTNSAWDATSSSASTSGVGSFKQMTRTNLTSFSPFAVVDRDALTGIDKVASNNVIIGVYPNPTVNFITIDFKNADAKTVEVYNEIGSKVYYNDSINKNSLQKIDMSNLPAGIYYVKVGTANEPVFKKVIKS